MAGSRIVSIILRGDVSGLRSSMTAASASVRGAADRMTGASREADRFRTSLSAVGDTAGRIGLVAAAGLTAIIATTAKFDKQMSAVQAATHETESAMDDLREAAIKAGASTAFSASEAAQGIEELAKAGVATKDILDGGLAGSLDLAAAGALDVGAAAEIAATAMTQFSLEGDQVGHVADLLAAGAGKAQGSVQDMGAALGQSGLVAAQTGLTIEETTGTLAAFASAGLIGSDAGTSFKTMLQSLTPSGEKAAGEMERLGVSAYDAQGNFVGMTKFADSLKNGLKDLSVEQQNAALKTIFGSDAVRAASVVFAQGGEGIQEWINKVDDSGFAAETAATRLDNFSGDLEAFKGALETALIGAGDGSTGPLREVTQGATDAVNVFNKLPGPVKSSTTAMLGITAVLGGGLWFTAKTIAGVAAMRTNMAALGVSSRLTALSMASVAKSAGLLGVAFVAIDSGSDIVDSFKRTTGAASETSTSFDKLVKNLEGSNVGKYASDFGIDINKLAVDIARFGEKGEYYAKVTKKMSEANDGVGGKGRVLGDFLTPWIGKTEKAGLASLDLGKIVDKTKVGIEVTGQAATDAATGTGELSDGLTATSESAAAATEEIKAAQEALDKARESALSTSLSFFNFSRDAKQSFGDYLNQLEKSADAYRDFTRNALEASDRGLDGGLIDQLKQQGPEGALALADFADASEREIARANRAFRDTTGLSELEAELSLLPDDIVTQFSVAGAPGAIAQAAEVANQYKMSPKLVETILKAKNYAKKDIDAVLAQMATLDQTVASPRIDLKTGGAAGQIAGIALGLSNLNGTIARTKTIHTTEEKKAAGGAILRAEGGSIIGAGTGTSDSIPALLSNGEHVLTAAEVQKAGGQGEIYRLRAAIRAGSLPAFKAGGAVRAKPTTLEIKEAEARIRDIERSLSETETVKRNGKKTKRKKLRGLDEEIARLQLAEAKKALRDLKNDTANKQDAADEAQEKADKIAEEDAEKAQKILDDAESSRLSAKSSAMSTFGIGTASSAAAVDRNLSRLLADSQTFLGLLGDLKAKGASPWLLAQLVEAGPTKGAIRLAREYNSNQSALDSINARSAQIDSYSNAYASLVGNAAFSQPQAWNSGVSTATQAPVTAPIYVYPAAGQSEAAIAHQVAGQLMWRMG